ncbi:MAG: hypothetical protein M1541_12665, partial [Acidobacteria bacterium]|nr:hypothetical protein [Acidobacteriota bacterium]
NAGVIPSSISGYPGHYVHDVRLSNIDVALRASGTEEDISKAVPENSSQYPLTRMFRVNLPSCGLYLRHVRDIAIDGLRVRPLETEPRPEVVADDVHGLQLSRLSTGHPKREKPRVRISNSTRVNVSGEFERI